MVAIGHVSPYPAEAVRRVGSARVQRLAGFLLVAFTMLVAAASYLAGPLPFVGAVLGAICLAAVVARPVWGLWFIAFFAVAGNFTTMPAYPFVQNFSTTQSILFIHNAIVINPFEVFLGAIVAGWIWRMAATGRWELRRGALFRPVMTFGLFAVGGMVYGLARGGDRTVALWEVRPILAMVVIYVLVTNLFDRPEHYRRMWAAMLAGVVVDAVVAIFFYRGLPSEVKDRLDALGDHQASLHANVLLVLLGAMTVMSARSGRRRALLLLVAPIVFTAYMLAQRRSAFVALGAAAIMLLATLFHRRPRAFAIVVPIISVVFVGYLAAFWNSTGSVAFPAQAVKTVISPDRLSKDDTGSNVYRAIENYNVVYTVRSQPIMGLGFGQKFLRPINNADISFFQWWEYRTHNSILWIWIQMGLGGFVAMLYMFAAAIRIGTRRLAVAASSYDAALLLTATAFVVMYAVFAYVDIAWDVESMIFLGTALGCIADSSFAPAASRRDVDGVPADPVAGSLLERDDPAWLA